jgi:WhiB family transcriptional regulator, redox-sensing transcriptional regulator
VWIQDWADRAACKGMDPDELFVQGAAQNRVKLICRGCPVRTECLAHALDSRQEFGVWGGMTERERRALLRRRPDVHSWRALLESARATYELSTDVLTVPPEPGAVVIAEFEALYAAEFIRLVIFLMKYGLSYPDANDAAQEAFIEALRQWQVIRSPRAWLRRVALRQHKQRPEYPQSEVPVNDPLDLPEDLEIREQTRFVMEAIRALPPAQRAVMAWTYDGFSPAEIAEQLECDASAVRKNLQRARATLKRALGLAREEGR